MSMDILPYTRLQKPNKRTCVRTEEELSKIDYLNTLANYLKENDLSPAVMFTISRTNLESFAEDMTTNLSEDDSEIPHTVYTVVKLKKFCENYQIIKYTSLSLDMKTL